MWQMVGILAELERGLIQERTQAGRAAAIARGVKMDRKALLSAQQITHARQLLAQGEPRMIELLSRSRCRDAPCTGPCRVNRRIGMRFNRLDAHRLRSLWEPSRTSCSSIACRPHQ